MKKSILAISGSIRNNSTNGNIIREIGNLVNKDFEYTIFDGLTELPYFSPDIDDSQISQSVKDFRKLIEESDGVIICTPEYVFSLPGILKNALEWTVSTTFFLISRLL